VSVVIPTSLVDPEERVRVVKEEGLGLETRHGAGMLWVAKEEGLGLEAKQRAEMLWVAKEGLVLEAKQGADPRTASSWIPPATASSIPSETR